MIDNLLSGFAPEFAVDLGTANTLLYLKGEGIVANEASFVAVHQEGKESGKVEAYGTRAKLLEGRTSKCIEALRPLEGGCIRDSELTVQMLRYFFEKVPAHTRLLKAKVLLGIPSGATEVEQRAVAEAATLAGGGKVFVVEEVMAAAIGAGIPVTDNKGCMVVDIGGGTTDVAVISYNDVVISRSTKTAGNKFDFLISEYVRRKHHVWIGNQTAERIKIEIGAARLTKDDPVITVQGRGVKDLMPAQISIRRSEVLEAIGESFLDIAKLVQGVLDQTPPEVAADLIDTGIVLVGGGALFPEIDSFLEHQTGLPVTLVEAPMTAVVEGAGKILEEWGKYQHLLTTFQSQK
ncbi:MAG: rod shape-determining protein [Deltaproteobacteria bacterium]|nr:rod shape-determining protein [Deltaproteobacteria bacterium]